ncbi:MAG: glycosyltransferase [Proteobacteria bacterium]|nr:glycosyltransferase [Pseudomonadota bacterium]
MRISLIIPTHNSFSEKRGSLDLTLRSLSQQNLGEYEAEVVVVDNGSDDRTRDVLALWATSIAPWPLSITSCPQVGAKARARNVGVSVSSGDIIFFMDDDILLPKATTVRQAIDMLVPRGFVCGVKRLWTYIGWDQARVARELDARCYDYALGISDLPNGIDRDSGYKSLLHVSFLAHFGCLERSLFEKVDGFDESYIGWGRHDCDLMYRLLVAAGAEFVNAYECGPIIHLNHPVKNRTIHLPANEERYSSLERKYGLTLRYSHLFGIQEHDDPRILVPHETPDHMHG